MILIINVHYFEVKLRSSPLQPFLRGLKWSHERVDVAPYINPMNQELTACSSIIKNSLNLLKSLNWQFMVILFGFIPIHTALTQ